LISVHPIIRADNRKKEELQKRRLPEKGMSRFLEPSDDRRQKRKKQTETGQPSNPEARGVPFPAREVSNQSIISL